jgi:hypothetical protein
VSIQPATTTGSVTVVVVVSWLLLSGDGRVRDDVGSSQWLRTALGRDDAVALGDGEDPRSHPGRAVVSACALVSLGAAGAGGADSHVLPIEVISQRPARAVSASGYWTR